MSEEAGNNRRESSQIRFKHLLSTVLFSAVKSVRRRRMEHFPPYSLWWAGYNGWRDKWSESRSVVSNSLRPHGLCSPWNSPGQNTGVGSLSLLQEIFPTQGSNPGLPHCRWILYQLSYKGSPRILEWVSQSLLQWIFPTQELNWGLLHCKRILYQLSYQGSCFFSFSGFPYFSFK